MPANVLAAIIEATATSAAPGASRAAFPVTLALVPAAPAVAESEESTEVAVPDQETASTLPQAAVQALVVRAQAGDQLAFARLYDLYARKIQSYLRFHLNGRADLAEDLASDVFLKALEKLGSYQFSGVPFSAWLYRIAHNHLVDYLRALPRRQGTSLDECLAVDDPAAERALEDTLQQHQVQTALKALTAEQRQVIVCRFLQDRSIADTARIMRKNEDAVKQLQVRALRNMRRTLVAA